MMGHAILPQASPLDKPGPKRLSDVQPACETGGPCLALA